MNLIQAMARQEGYYEPNSRAHKNNNPLNIVANEFSKKYAGYVGSDGTFCKFKTADDGFNAAYHLLSITAEFENRGTDQEKLVKGYCGATLKQVIYRWTETDQAVYLKNVSAWTALGETTVITQAILNRP